jgi:hypothetical protein
MRRIQVLLSAIIVLLLAIGAGIYWHVRISQKAVREARILFAMTRDNVQAFRDEVRGHLQANLEASRDDARMLRDELRQIEIQLSRMQDDITAATFNLGRHSDPADIVLGPRDTYEHLDHNWKSFADTTNKVPAPCLAEDGKKTLVIVTLGQSNAANTGSAKYASTRGALNFNLYDGRCYLAADPLLGASNDGGNFATRLADTLIARGVADRVILAPIAMGGTSVEQWAYEGLFNRRIRALIRRLHDARLPTHYILWHQGEGNPGTLDVGGRQYRKNLLEVVHTFRQYGIAAPFFIALATRCGAPHPHGDVIRSGQRGAVNAQIGTFLGPDTDSIGNEHRHDYCHMNESGLELHAKGWADAITRHWLEAGRAGAHSAWHGAAAKENP